ncbi:phage tail protein [Nonomuraea sp. NPDC003707]
MSDKSGWLRHLPLVLWQDEPETPEFGLGAALRIFEKVLTGIPDGVPLPHPPHEREHENEPPREHEHEPITTEIARLDRLFDPWTTPEPFLPWLASWVALRFPTLQDAPLWDEYQRRKVISEIARIYRLRGRKAGLDKYLELYAVGRTRPRVALDDGTRLLTVTPGPEPGTTAPVAGLVVQGPVVTDAGVRVEGVTRPWCVAAGTDGGVFAGDIALPAGVSPQLKNRVWRLSPAGNHDVAGTPPKPRPVSPDTLNLTRVVGAAVRPARGAAPETLYVLDRAGQLYAVPAPFPDTPATQIISLATVGAPLWPVAMTVDPGSGDLLVLDRGDGPGSPSRPKIIIVRTDPPAATRTTLRTVVEPLSLAVEPGGTLLVGDGGDQEPAAPARFPGNLVRVTRAAPAWTETLLLPADNPLVAPTAIAHTRDGRLYVLDAGLKPFAPSATDPFICAVAEHAAVFEVDPAAAPPTAVRITEPGQFVYPTGMAAAGDRLVVCDPGQPEVAGLQPFWSRVRPFQFGVVVHFAEGRLPPDPSARQLVLNQAVGNIRSIIDQEKPAHTLWNLITAI